MDPLGYMRVHVFTLALGLALRVQSWRIINWEFTNYNTCVGTSYCLTIYYLGTCIRIGCCKDLGFLL